MEATCQLASCGITFDPREQGVLVEGDFHDGSNPYYCSAEHAHEDQGELVTLTQLPLLYAGTQDSSASA
jgi:hypothetical protein